ncbi:MAG TPA: GNAT family N-acetyltransferase [Thermoanaerobaculia bacterium]|nr:GNAT family N-acetyltransferase [Thermoanaerobaculia bacterium]
MEALSATGLAAGARLLVRLSPGRLWAGAFPEPDDARGRCRLLAADLGDLAARVRELHARLPLPPEEVLAEEGPETVESSIQGTLEWVLMDSLEPAIRSLLEAASLSQEELDREWEELETERQRLRGLRGPLSIHKLAGDDLEKMRELAVSLFEGRLASGDEWKSGRHVLGFMANGGPRGLAGFLFALYTPGDLGLLTLVVDSEARGADLGRTLLDHAVDELRERGLELTELVGVCMIDPEGKAS